MNIDIAKRWAHELRTTQCGQTTGRLKESVEDCQHPAFCVLGVLCDLYLREHGESWSHVLCHDEEGELVEDTWYVLECDAAAPQEVLQWAGLTDDSRIAVGPEQEAILRDAGQSLQVRFEEANDDLGVSFERFADLIEQQAERL